MSTRDLTNFAGIRVHSLRLTETTYIKKLKKSTRIVAYNKVLRNTHPINKKNKQGISRVKFYPSRRARYKTSLSMVLR